MALRDFTDEEMALLARVIKRERDSIRNTPSRPTQDRSFDENQDWLAPEVYIAKPREEIPALEAGTGGANDQPGYASADVYRITLDGVGTPGLSKAFEQNRRVHNLTDSVISLGFVVILRDKYGNWIALPLSSGTQIVRIKVEEMTEDFEDCRAAICTVLSKTCGRGLSNVYEEGGTGLGELERILVVDALGCLFEDDPVGSEGYAALMDAQDYYGTGTAVLDIGTGSGPASNDCRWECIGLCCP